MTACLNKDNFLASNFLALQQIKASNAYIVKEQFKKQVRVRNFVMPD